MPLITSEDSFSSGKRAEARSFNLEKVIKFFVVPFLILVILAALFVNKDRIAGLIPGGGETTQARDENAGEDLNNKDKEAPAPETSEEEIPELEDSPAAPKPPEVPAIDTGAKLYDKVLETYKMPVVHTKGFTSHGDSRIDFDTVWSTDRQIGSGTITFNGKTTDTYVIKGLLFVRNTDNILADIIGTPVPLPGWVLVNASDEIQNVYPDTYLMEPVKGKQEVKAQNGLLVADDFHAKLSEDKKHLIDFTAPRASWSLEPGNGDHIKPVEKDFRADGKVEKDPDGRWKVFRLKS